MDLRWLEDVLVLLEERNLSRAAQRRNVTQPAFSRRIGALESWLGVSLLERRANRVVLRASLVANEAEIRSTLARVQEMRDRLASYAPDRFVMPIAMQHALTVAMFPAMVAAAREQVAAAGFQVRVGTRAECVSMFVRGEVRMLMCYEDAFTARLPFDASVNRTRVGADDMVLVAGRGLHAKLARRGLLPVDTPAITYPENSHFGALLGANRAPFALARSTPTSVCETAFSSCVKQLVHAGMGVGWLPRQMVVEEVAAGDIRVLGKAYASVPLETLLYHRSADDAADALAAAWRGLS